jgi:hypothetical protein
MASSPDRRGSIDFTSQVTVCGVEWQNEREKWERKWKQMGVEYFNDYSSFSFQNFVLFCIIVKRGKVQISGNNTYRSKLYS